MKNAVICVVALLFMAGLVFAQPVIQWQRCLGGSNNDEASSIQQTTDGGYIVAGRSPSNDGDVSGLHEGINICPDFWVVKLAPDEDLNIQANNTIPSQLHLTAHPNPFNSACHISTPIGATVEIYNLSGQKVAQPPGDNITWRPTQNKLPSGVHLIRATIGEQSLAKRRVIYLK